MSAFKPQQHHLRIRGRLFHFVSYEGQPADHRRDQPATPDMWYLMVEGRRCPVRPCDSSQSLTQLEAALQAWAEDNALGPVEARRSAEPAAAGSAPPAESHRQGNWWGPK